MQKIRKGDEVIVTAGRDKGCKGMVQAVLDGGEMLLVEGVNLKKKHVKANPNAGEQGGIKSIARAIRRCKVKIFNAATQKGDRVGIRVLEDGRKVRFYKSTNEEIEV